LQKLLERKKGGKSFLVPGGGGVKPEGGKGPPFGLYGEGKGRGMSHLCGIRGGREKRESRERGSTESLNVSEKKGERKKKPMLNECREENGEGKKNLKKEGGKITAKLLQKEKKKGEMESDRIISIRWGKRRTRRWEKEKKKSKIRSFL